MALATRRAIKKIARHRIIKNSTSAIFDYYPPNFCPARDDGQIKTFLMKRFERGVKIGSNIAQIASKKSIFKKVAKSFDKTFGGGSKIG